MVLLFTVTSTVDSSPVLESWYLCRLHLSRSRHRVNLGLHFPSTDTEERNWRLLVFIYVHFSTYNRDSNKMLLLSCNLILTSNFLSWQKLCSFSGEVNWSWNLPAMILFEEGRTRGLQHNATVFESYIVELKSSFWQNQDGITSVYLKIVKKNPYSTS